MYNDSLSYDMVEEDIQLVGDTPLLDWSEDYDTLEKFISQAKREFEFNVKFGVFYIVVTTLTTEKSHRTEFTIDVNSSNKYKCESLDHDYNTLEGICSDLYYYITQTLKDKVRLISPF